MFTHKSLTTFLLPLLLWSCQDDTGSSPPDEQKGIVQANGISIAYESFGAANDEAILLIQGTGTQLTGWPVELCEQLADQGYRVIRFDNRDVGLSSKMDSLGMPDWAAIIPQIGTCGQSGLPYTLLDMAKDAVGLLDALHIGQAHIVGASMGGAIAQLVAIHFPERVLSLTSVMASSGNPALPPGDPEVLQIMGSPPPQTQQIDSMVNYLFNIYKAISSPGYPTPDSVLKERALRNIQRSWYPAGNARHAAAVLLGDNCDRREQLKHIALPTVIFHGESDPVVHVAAANELAATIPHAKLITIPSMGHDLPDALIPTLREAIVMAAQEPMVE